MTQCIGWAGRIFGHKIERLLIAEIPIVQEDFWSNVVSIQALTGRTPAKRKWKLACTRCGYEPAPQTEHLRSTTGEPEEGKP